MEAPWVQLREDSHGIPMVIPMGIPTEILWEWEKTSLENVNLILDEKMKLNFVDLCYHHGNVSK